MKDVKESAMNGVNGSSKRKKGSDLCVITVKIGKIGRVIYLSERIRRGERREESGGEEDDGRENRD